MEMYEFCSTWVEYDELLLETLLQIVGVAGYILLSVALSEGSLLDSPNEKSIKHPSIEQSWTHRYLSKRLQFFIVLQEEGQILETDINIWITTKTPMFLFSLFSSRESMLVNFIFYLACLISHEYATIWVTSAHFRLRSLKSREEFGIDERRFGMFEL